MDKEKTNLAAKPLINQSLCLSQTPESDTKTVSH